MCHALTASWAAHRLRTCTRFQLHQVLIRGQEREVAQQRWPQVRAAVVNSNAGQLPVIAAHQDAPGGLQEGGQGKQVGKGHLAGLVHKQPGRTLQPAGASRRRPCACVKNAFVRVCVCACMRIKCGEAGQHLLRPQNGTPNWCGHSSGAQVGHNCGLDRPRLIRTGG